jgi:superfamily II RNA helicase
MDAEDTPLLRRLPPEDDVTPDTLLEGFLDYVEELGLELYPAQEEAILEVFAGKNVILNTPTGSGKSLVATAVHFKAIAEGKRAFYTAPIKALVSEKFFALCRAFGPDEVGMMTGDATINRDASIICCTAEILMNLALREGHDADVEHVVMDEFHFYADRDRGVAWQVPLLTLPQSAFLLMSATLGDTRDFQRGLTRLNGRDTSVVHSAERPVPLDFEYRETPLQETVQDLLSQDKAPIYIVHFTQRSAAEQAQNLMSVDFLSKPQKKAVKETIQSFRFDSPYGKDLKRHVPHGIGVHHAGLLPKYRLLVEKLAQQGYLKVICGTDTLGVGVNIPIRTVLFTQLCKFDGEQTKVLSVRQFKQVAGRAGRKGFDEHGSVVVQAPDHVIENKQLREKAGDDPKKLRKMVLKKPPDKGYAHWDRHTFERLVASEPERLTSSFQVTHGMMLNVLAREKGGCDAMKHLIRNCHEGPTARHRHARQAISMFRSLVESRVVELVPKEQGAGKRPVVNADLQSDFSLNQTLSLYVVEAIEVLDPDSVEYAANVLTLVESILENPKIILARQLDKLKGQTVAELKEAGYEYEERMKILDELEHPKPHAEFIYGTFNDFASRHPWVGAENIRPKSVAREMFENGHTFNDYVKEYGLQRSEGLLLRYLSDAYKALIQNVPESSKTDEVYELTDWLGTIVRSIDSSLLDEWEKMRDPQRMLQQPSSEEEPEPQQPADITTDEHAFTVLVRNEVWKLVKQLSGGQWSAAATMVDAPEGEEPWTAERLEERLAPFWEEHEAIRTDPVARSPRNTQIFTRPGWWRVHQVLADPEDHNEWMLDLWLDLDRCRREDRPVLQLAYVGT